MAISSGIAIRFKEDCLEGVHHFTSATFKIALYTSIASLSNGTSVFNHGLVLHLLLVVV